MVHPIQEIHSTLLRSPTATADLKSIYMNRIVSSRALNIPIELTSITSNFEHSNKNKNPLSR